MQQHHKREGFTLIELLVVIAIIAILAAILFPVFAQAREKARQTTCLSNEKQILMAIMMYNEDYDEVYPVLHFAPHWDGNINSDDQDWSIENEVDPYIKAGVPWGPTHYGTIWNCPDDSIARDDCDGAMNIGTGFAISYGFTTYSPTLPMTEYGVFADWFSGGNIQSQALAAVGDPSDTIIMYEFFSTENYSRFGAAGRYNNADIQWWPWVYPNLLDLGHICDGEWYFSIGAHNGMTNFGFADGHVHALNHSSIMHTVNGVWNGQAPNMMHWNGQYHLQ